MSEHSDSAPETEPDGESGSAPDSGAATERSAPASERAPADRSGSPSRGTGRLLAGSALLLSLAALALSARPYWAPEPEAVPAAPASAIAALETRIDRLDQQITDRMSALSDARSASGADAEQRLEALSGELAELRATLESGPDAIEALTRRVGRLEGAQSTAEAGLEARMAALETRIEQRVTAMQERLGALGADLEVAGRESARRLALIDADALLEQGRDRWILSGDASAAQAAWARARARLDTLERTPGDDALFAALERLGDAAARLRSVDVAERVTALDALAAAAGDWPAPVASAPAEDAASEESAGWRQRVGRAVGRLVHVEAIEDAPPTPAEVDAARGRVSAALSAAAVAAARLDWATAAALVGRARSDLAANFDVEDAEVAAALDRLAELAQPPVERELPSAYDEVRTRIDAVLGRDA